MMQIPLVLLLAQSNSSGSLISVVTVTGIVVVFSALVLLTLLIKVYGSIVYSLTGGKKGKKKPEKKVRKELPADDIAPLRLPTSPVDMETSNNDIIAVIAAAVAAFGESTGKSYAVKSVKRSDSPSGRRSAWARAGILDNTRPF